MPNRQLLSARRPTAVREGSALSPISRNPWLVFPIGFFFSSRLTSFWLKPFCELGLSFESSMKAFKAPWRTPSSVHTHDGCRLLLDVMAAGCGRRWMTMPRAFSRP